MTDRNGRPPEPPAPLKELREQARRARLELEVERCRVLRESLAWWDGFGGSDLLDRVRPRTNDGDGWVNIFPAVPADRRHGSEWPMWRTQYELDVLRQQSRVRARTNSFAQGLLRNLTNTVVGKGFDYKAAWLGDDGKPAAEETLTDGQRSYLRDVQKAIDGFCKLNHWNCAIDPRDVTALAATREREAFRAVLVDGECYLRFHFQEGGATLVRFLDPARVRDGSGHLVSDGWSYGEQHQMTPFEDVETTLRYVAFWPDPAAKGGAGGDDEGTWEEVDAKEVLHLKGPDTPATVKRGTPLLVFDLGDALDRAAKLQKFASAGAIVRAASAEMTEHDQATQAQVQSMRAAVADRQVTDPVSGKATNVERLFPGMRRDFPAGRKLVEYMNDNTPAYMAGVQGDLQQACAGAGIASFVIGDVSSGNYSNYESASFPPVVNAQCEQEYYKAAFARAVWKALEWAAECGVLPADVAGRVTVLVEAPAVLHRNELEKAQEDEVGVTAGWKDRQTCAAERGLDWKQVSANNDEYARKQQAMQPQPEPGVTVRTGPDKPPAGGKPPGAAPVRESIDAEHGPGAALAVARAAVRLLEGAHADPA